MSWGLNCKQYKMFYVHIKYLLLITVNIIIQITLDSKKLQKRNLRRQISKPAPQISSFSSYKLGEFVQRTKFNKNVSRFSVAILFLGWILHMLALQNLYFQTISLSHVKR